MIGDPPRQAVQLGSAPFATSARMVSPSFIMAAKCSGLMPVSFRC